MAISAGNGSQGAGPLLVADNVTLQYKTEKHLVTATFKVSFEVHGGDRYVLLGPSGCGKSSLLKAIAGFLPPVGGEFRLAGKVDRAAGLRPHDGVPGIRPVAAVEDSARQRHVPAAGQPPHAAGARRAITRARSSPRSISAEFENIYPHMLSGGMKQRVAIARALAMEPARAADGRAVRRARRADAPQDAGRAAGAVGRGRASR